MTPAERRDLYSHGATVLPVVDVERARRFYQDGLGFSVDFTWGDPPSYIVLTAGESVSVHLSRVDTPPPPDARGTIVYLFVRDVDALHDGLVDRGVDVHAGPETMAYGMREFEVVDPDGHRLVFGQGVGAP